MVYKGARYNQCIMLTERQVERVYQVRPIHRDRVHTVQGCGDKAQLRNVKMKGIGTQGCLLQSAASHSKELLQVFSNKGVAVVYTGLSLCQPFCLCFKAHVQGVYTKMG